MPITLARTRRERIARVVIRVEDGLLFSIKIWKTLMCLNDADEKSSAVGRGRKIQGSVSFLSLKTPILFSMAFLNNKTGRQNFPKLSSNHGEPNFQRSME